MFQKITGNVFQNYEQCFFETMGEPLLLNYLDSFRTMASNISPVGKQYRNKKQKKIGISNHLTNSEEGMLVTWLGRDAFEKNSLKSLLE